MKTYRLYQVDAFAMERFCGNPAGVVPNADGLTDSQMQLIAREMNNSETAFIFAGNAPDHDVHVRFFTPTQEVPLCGHATVSAHYVRALEISGAGEKRPMHLIQKTGAGLLPVDVIPEGEDYAVVMTQGKPEFGDPLPEDTVSRIAAELGLSMQDLRADCPVCYASCGHGKIMVGIRDLQKLHGMNPDDAALIRLSREVGCDGWYVFTLHPDEEILVHGRMFSPAIGIKEDPVTGNANGPLGAYLMHWKVLPERLSGDVYDFDILQGEAIGRAGTMHVHVEGENGEPRKVQIRGHAVIAFRTEIQL